MAPPKSLPITPPTPLPTIPWQPPIMQQAYMAPFADSKYPLQDYSFHLMLLAQAEAKREKMRLARRRQGPKL
ncbi:hypothetical protein B0A55_01405 [Friedmanniomyces simplex]|uniref:Uncharacterized protein n=1 Tax=Friedmanniomyces simplex TaxID=329884 RepID=A0A4V5NIA8_9PEZI|nr:hypothetical protein B0A55_01405 [Friedmanniomyces simplex]